MDYNKQSNLKDTVPCKRQHLKTALQLSIFCMLNAAQAIGQYRPDYDCPEQLFPKRDKQTRLFGYADVTGEFKVAPAFLRAYLFAGKFAVVQQGKQLGILGCGGQLSVPASYDDIKGLVNGKAWMLKNSKWGLIAAKGQVLVPPIFDSIAPITERSDYAWVKKNGKWGIFNRDAVKMTFEPKYDDYKNFTDSLLIGRNGAQSDIINLKALAIGFDSISTIKLVSPKLLAFEKRGRWWLIDGQSHVLAYNADSINFNAYLCKADKDGKVYLFSTFGKPIKTDVTKAKLGESMLWIGYKNGKAGAFLPNSKAIIEPQFDEIYGPFGVLLIIEKGETLAIYRKGQDSLPTNFQYIKHKLVGYNYVALTSETGIDLFETSGGRLLARNVTGAQMEAGNLTYTKDARALLLGKNNEASIDLEPKSAIENAEGFLIVRGSQEVRLLAVQNLRNVLGSDKAFNVTVDTLNGKLQGFFVKTSNSTFYLDSKEKRSGLDKELDAAWKANDFRIEKVGSNFRLINVKNGEEITKKLDTLYLPRGGRLNVVIGKKDDRFSLYNASGKVGQEYDSIRYIGANLFASYLKGNGILINVSSTRVSNIAFSSTGNFANGLCSVLLDGRYGFINQKGSLQIPVIFEKAWPFNIRGYALIKLNGKYGLIDKAGKYVMLAQYSSYAITSSQGYRLMP